MKNIAIFTSNLKVGGIQKSIVNLLDNLDYSKVNVDLYLFDKDNFFEVNKNINVIYLNRPSKIFSFMPFNLVKKLLKINLLDKEYDVSIDFDSYQMSTAVGALSCKSKKKYIWIHNDIVIKLKEEFKYKILYTFFKKKYKYFDGYVAVSDGALDSFKKLHNYNSKEYYVIPNYINTNEIKEKLNEVCDLVVDNNLINIVSVGRLCHQKGIDIMLNNIKELTNYRKDFHLYIIGDGPLKEELINQTKDLDLSSYVSFLGNQKNPYKYMNKMDLFYLSSRYEGQGMVLLEAVSVGLDVLIPEHLEKYCPLIKGENNVIKFLKEYKKREKYSFNYLNEYNKNIINLFNNLI